jgi:hypothetical protein
MNDVMTTGEKPLTWGTPGSADFISVNPSDVSLPNMFVLALQGFRHKLGNEVAAKVTALKKTEDGKQLSEDEITAKAKEFRAEMLEKILNGELGVRAVSSGPRVSGIEAIKRTIAVEILKKRLDAYSKKTGNKVTLPTKDETREIMGKVMTREQMIESMLRQQADVIEAEAKRRMETVEDEADVGEDLFA